jgi:serine/threonine-protein kinase HipA
VIVKSRRGLVSVNNRPAGTICETADGYTFAYDAQYLADKSTAPVSLTMPKRAEPYVSRHLFPAFCGILAEGSLAEMQCRELWIDERDIFGRLLQTCHETIGALSVRSLP